jgi:hypothetical protein
MKILRSMNHRDFTVEPAGYFNVLRPSKRFASAHPPGQFSYLPGQSKATAATAPQFASVSLPDHKATGDRLLRPAMIVLGATALTIFFLWWSAGFPIHMIF